MILLNNTDHLAKNTPTHYYFWLFIILHTLAWTIGPAFFRTSLPHDTLEGITWGLQWQFGYSKHPFLTAWLSAATVKLFHSVGWPIYFLAQIVVSSTFFAAWQLAKQYLPAPHALIASLLLDGVLFYNINSFNLTPDTLQSPLWAFLALFFYHAFTTQKISYWIWTGFFAALCLCTKYQAGLLFFSLLIFCLVDKTASSSFKKPGIYIALVVFILLMSPHLVWLYHHDLISINYALKTPAQYTQQKSLFNSLIYFFKLIVNNLIDVLGLLILVWPFYKSTRIRLNLIPSQWKYLIFISFGPLILTLMLCLASGDYFPPRWSTPYFFSLGLFMMVILRPELSPKKIKQFTITLLTYSTLLLSIKISTIALHLRPASDAYLPNQQIALSLTTLWHNQYHSPLPYIAGSGYLVAITTPYMIDNPKPFFNWSLIDSPWIDLSDLKKKGAILIWDIGKNFMWDFNSSQNTRLPKSIQKKYPNLIILPQQIFYRTHDKTPIPVGVAILPPSPYPTE